MFGNDPSLMNVQHSSGPGFRQTYKGIHSVRIRQHPGIAPTGLRRKAELPCIRITTHDLLQELSQPIAALQNNTTSGPIGIRLDDREPSGIRIALNLRVSIVDGILLVFGRHSHIFSNRYGCVMHLVDLLWRSTSAVGEKTLALLPKYRQPAEMSAGSGIG
jgi:hypothetical protein